MVVGGVPCSAFDTAASLTILLAAPGLMIRQPLKRAGSPLADCDYHAVAAPYRARFCTAAPGQQLRRGAAGRHIAKQAFCTALSELLSWIEQDPWAAWEAAADLAWKAFASDPGYAAQIASAARKVPAAVPLLAATA